MSEKFKEWFTDTTNSTKRPILDFIRRIVVTSGHQYMVWMVKEQDIQILVEIEERIYGKALWNYAILRVGLQRPRDRLYLVVEDGQQIVGFMGTAIDWYHYDLHITNIGTTPSYQNKGIGTYPISTAENYVRHLKLHSLSLEARVHNISARCLYEGLGFHNQHIKSRYYLDNHGDAVDMQANLLR